MEEVQNPKFGGKGQESPNFVNPLFLSLVYFGGLGGFRSEFCGSSPMCLEFGRSSCSESKTREVHAPLNHDFSLLFMIFHGFEVATVKDHEEIMISLPSQKTFFRPENGKI